MTYKVYIQAVKGFPVDDFALSAYMGWRNSGTTTIFFEDLEEVPVSKWNIVVADIETTYRYFEKLGINPMSLNIPTCIEEYAGRKIVRTRMAHFRDNLSPLLRYPVFIKPDGRSKEFVAGVIKEEKHLAYLQDFSLGTISDECPILLSEVVNFVSEYRAYVIEGEVVGLFHYLGDWKIFPSVEIIQEAVAKYSKESVLYGGAPAGYAMDFGVIEGKYGDHETVLVECNDGWSLGNYGLEPSKYCRLLGRRWHELMKVN